MAVIRLGAGAGHSGDRVEPPIDLAERGRLDDLVFECLAERTIAPAQQRRRRDPDAGYDTLLDRRVSADGSVVVTKLDGAGGAVTPTRPSSIRTARG